MKALVLSGGTGTRLRPLTYSTPKQLLPAANKPILFHIIEKIARAGIHDIGIIVGDTRMEVMAAAGDGQRWGVDITYIHQPIPLGLAHAVKMAAGFLGGDSFLMILGDNLFQMELNGFLSEFEENKANASLLLVPMDDPAGFGVASVKDGRITYLVEKPDRPESNLVVTGIYLFDKSIFRAIDMITPSWRNELEITDAIQKMIQMGRTVTYKQMAGWWKDTGNPAALLEASRFLLDEPGESSGNLCVHDSVLTGKVLVEGPIQIENSIIRGPVILGAHTAITDSCVGPYVSAEEGVCIRNCTVEDSILLKGAVLERFSARIQKSIIGKYTSVRGAETNSKAACLVLGDNSSLVL